MRILVLVKSNAKLRIAIICGIRIHSNLFKSYEKFIFIAGNLFAFYFYNNLTTCGWDSSRFSFSLF